MGHDYKNKELLVIDLGSYSIKALIAKAGSKGITVRKALTIPLSVNIYSNGDVQNQLELTSVLSDIVKEHGMKNHPVIFTFSSSNSFARIIEVPTVKSTEMKEVIDYEMQQYLPVDAAAYMTQYRLMEGITVKNERQNKVLVGVIPKILAENLMNIAKNSELIPYVLDIHPNALIKLVRAVSQAEAIGTLSDQNIAFIELGHTLMDINIFEKGEFQFNRRILMGGMNIDQRIERVLDVSLDDARMEKHNNTDINQEVFEYTNENRVFNSVRTGVDEWIAEIEKVVNFYNSRKAGNRLDRCLIYGGGTGIHGIDRYIGESLTIKTEVIGKLPGLVEGTDISEEQFPLFVNALGAILREEGQKI